MRSARRCGPAMRSLTGHDSYLVLANGTMALAAAIAAVCEDSATIDLPALGCWTLTRAALDSDVTVTYHDVNDRLQGVGAAADSPHVRVAPWWGELGDDPTIGPLTVLDLSVNCDPAPTPGAACVISMGPAKPAANPRHGGVLAFSGRRIGRCIDRLISMADEHGNWARMGPRITGAAISDDEIERHFNRLRDSAREHREAVESATDFLLGADAVLDPVWRSPTGSSFFTPFLLPRGLGLHARDVARLAATWRVPLGTQPVSPAYLEPATSRCPSVTRTRRCATAEDLSRRLVFVPSYALQDSPRTLARLVAFTHWLQDCVSSQGAP